MADLDRLEVQVEASAAKANAELNKLVNKLDKVASSLSGINSSGLVGFANGIEKLGKSMQTVNSVKTSDFTRLANNIQKLSSLDTAGLNTTSSALVLLGKSLANFGAASKSAENIAAMTKNLSKLGGKNVQNAIDNMPRLATGLKELLTTLAQAPNVSRNVIQMTRALAELTNALNGARNGGDSGNDSTEKINKLSEAFSKLSGSITKSGRSMKSFSEIAGKLYAKCYALVRILKRLGSAAGAAMDYVETYNYFGVTMNKVGKALTDISAENGSESAEEYAKSFTDRMNELTRKMTGYKVGDSGELYMTDNIGMGMDPEKIMNFQAKIGALTNSVGLCGEVSIDAADALTRLAGDWSSLANKDLDAVMTNFTSGLLGQSRAMYQYGIDITNATLQQKAYELGVTKSVSAMSQAEKMQLRLLQMLERSKIAYGDMGNTLITVSNQYRIMKQQISNLARTIGNLLLPIAQKVLPVINGMIIALQRLFNILGFKIWGDNWLKDVMGGVGSGGYSDDSLGDLGDDADAAADSLGDAAKAAEKLKTATLGIDELNINAPQEESGSGSGANGSGGGDAIDLSGAIADALGEYTSVWDEAFENAQNKAQEYADAISGFFSRMWKAIEPFRDAVSRLWNEGLKKLMDFTFQNLKNFYDEFLVPIGMWAFGTEGAGLTRLVDIVNNQLLRIDWEGITKNLKDFWHAIEPYAEQFGEGLIDFFEDISGIAVDVINNLFGEGGAITKITDWLDDHDPETARKWGYAFGVLSASMVVLSGIGSAIAGIAGIGTALSGIASGLSVLFGAEGVFASIGAAITRLFAERGIFGSGGLIIKSLEGIQTFITSMTGGAVAVPLGVIAAAIATVVLAIVDLWRTSEGFRDAVKTAFSQIVASFSQAFSNVFKGVSKITGSLKKLFSVLYGIYDNSPLKDLVELIGIFAAKLIGFAASTAIQTIGNMILGFCDILSGAIDVVSGFLQVLHGFLNLDSDELLSGIKSIGEGIVRIFEGAFTLALGSLDGFIAEWGISIANWWNEKVAPWFTLEKWKKLLSPIKTAFVQKWNETAGQWEKDISSWWNENVAPWFTLEKWKNLYTKIKDALKNIWDETVQQWKTGISRWWNENVAPWFTLEKWKTLYSTIKSALKTKWDETVQQWKTGISRWWNENVAPWFTLEKWKTLYSTIKSALKTKWDETVQQWKSSISNWWENNVKPWFTASKWLGAMGGIKEGFSSAFKNAANAAIDVINRLIRFLNEKLKISWDGFTLPNGDKVGSFSMRLFKMSEIAHFASGGYPETGELFMARENGINEMVGRIGTRSAVANNDQITDAIRAAVVQGMNTEEQNALLREQNSLLRAILAKDTDVTLDGKSLVNGIDKARKRMGWDFQAT